MSSITQCDTRWLTHALTITPHAEGCERRRGGFVYPYLDKLASPPRWTRGYGRTYGIGEDSPPITLEEAVRELGDGLTAYCAQVLRLAPALATRPECLGTVVDWAWNCGVGAFKASRLRRAINEGRWWDAAELIRKPDTAGGVVYAGLRKRRQANRALFLLGCGG